jgi:hypothetical protein
MSERPALYCPFPETAVHPEAEALARRTLAWAGERGLLPDDDAATAAKVRSYSLLAARCYPQAPFERLAAICDYYSWLFFFDDVCENLSLAGASDGEVRALLLETYGALAGHAGGSASRFAASLDDIWRRVAPLCPPAWHARFGRHVTNYVDGCVWEAQNRRLRRPPSRAVFQAMRMFTSTMYEFWDFIEYAGDFCLPDEVVDHPVLAELRRAANAVASFANDLLSFHKEAQNGDMHNLVTVVQREEGLSLGAAFARAAALHDAQARHYRELERLVPSFGASTDRDVARYLEGMRVWMRANYDWSLTTPRYVARPASPE